MHRFEVWAPLAKELAVQVTALLIPCRGPTSMGWWVDVNDARHGTDYGFLIDDETQPYPDPRSLWQPHGVHALSRVYDQRPSNGPTRDGRRRRWPAPSSMRCTLAPLRHEGTLDAAIDKLDHLVELGHHACRADAGGGVCRRPRLGLRRRGALSPCTRHTAAPMRSSALSMPPTAAAWPCCSMWSITTSAP